MSRTFTGEALSWEHVHDALEVRLIRAPANEIGTTTLRELERLAEYVRSGSGGARALIWYSIVERGFCAGADLRELHAGLMERQQQPIDVARRMVARLPDGAKDVLRSARPLVGRAARPLIRRQIRAFIDRIHRVFNTFDAAPITTIAAVHGVCFGGGFEWALTADLIVADKTARFCFPELRLGLVPGFGGIPRLTRDVGNGVARDLLLTGRSLRATRAHELGIVSQVVANGKALQVARSLAKQAARFDPTVTARAKAFAKPIPHDFLEREKLAFCEMVMSPAVLEALTNFVDDDSAMPWLSGGTR
ncbi:MAG: enoyl-CoA hydratase/carnithine racemase [Kiritimatiellia bacterium]|jgi:enoyl-CoA hydratase/carnithine racemase